MSSTELTKRFILTGAPGAGKTSIGEGLLAKGHSVVRDFMDLHHKQKEEGWEKPLEDPQFIDKLTALQLQRMNKELAGDGSPPFVFYDRSPICTLALCLFMQRSPPECLLEAIEAMKREKRFQTTVLFVMSLGFIETTDIRTLNYEQQLAFEALHRRLYDEHGFRCLEIPALPKEERIQFVLDSVLAIPSGALPL